MTLTDQLSSGDIVSLRNEAYRFLLFEEKREVELVWNGKTNEVCNIVLPFQVIEQMDETRAEKEANFQKTLLDPDNRGRQLKMQRLRQWCQDINRAQHDKKYDFVYVDQESFEKYHPKSFRQLVDAFKEYKNSG